MSGEKILNVGIGVLVLCAVAVTGVTLRQHFSGPSHAAAATAPQHPQRERISDATTFAVHGHRSGSAGGVTVVVFSDFQCPACAILADQLQVLAREYGETLGVVYRHYPLPGNPHGRAAAQASECAASQGRFHLFHDILFAAQHAIGTVPWTRFAELAGVPDLREFERCVRDRRTDDIVRRDIEAGRRLGVAGTPTLLVGSVRVRGVGDLEMLRREIERQRTGER